MENIKRYAGYALWIVPAILIVLVILTCLLFGIIDDEDLMPEEDGYRW